jgi:hypothetical protein
MRCTVVIVEMRKAKVDHMLKQCNLVVDYSFSPLQEQKCMAAANMTIKDIVYVKSFCTSA